MTSSQTPAGGAQGSSESPAEKPASAAQEKADVLQGVRMSLAALRESVTGTIDAKEANERAVLTQFLAAAAEAQRLVAEGKLDARWMETPDMQQAIAGVAEATSEADAAKIREALVAIPAEFAQLASEVESARRARNIPPSNVPETAQATGLTNETSAMARLETLTREGQFLSRENIKKLAGSIPFLAQKDANGNPIEMSDERVGQLQQTALRMLQSFVAGLLERMHALTGGAPEFRWAQQTGAEKSVLKELLQDPAIARDPKKAALVQAAINGSGSELERAWKAAYKRALRNKPKGQPLDPPDVSVVLDGLVSGGAQTGVNPEQAAEKKDEEKRYDMSDEALSYTVVAGNKELTFRNGTVKLGDKSFAIKVKGAKALGLVVSANAQGEKEVRFSTGGKESAKQPLSALVARMEQEREKTITIGTITLERLETVA